MVRVVIAPPSFRIPSPPSAAEIVPVLFRLSMLPELPIPPKLAEIVPEFVREVIVP